MSSEGQGSSLGAMRAFKAELQADRRERASQVLDAFRAGRSRPGDAEDKYESQRLRLLAEVAGLLKEGETVLYCTDYGADVLAVTSTRLIVVEGKPTSLRAFPPRNTVVFDKQACQVERDRGALLSKVRIRGAAGKLKLRITNDQWDPLWDAFQSDGTATTSMVKPPHAAEDATDPVDVAEQLRSLTELHSSGALSPDEFNAAKARVLGLGD